MERHFDEELKALHQKSLMMADHTQEMITRSIESLVSRSLEKGERVLQIEDTVNRLEVEIEEEVLRLLAIRQPAGKDLRFLVALLKITADLERIADQACNISQTVYYLLQEPPLKVPLLDLPTMASLAQGMLRRSLEAFVRHDVGLAKKVCEEDDAIDYLHHQSFRVLLTHMMENPKAISTAVDLILISRNLERIADHSTNIAEEVVFIEEGRNIKHHLQESGS